MRRIFRFRRLQFGLGTLLGFMAMAAICAAYYGSRLRAFERQEQAFRQIASKGGIVHVYSYGTSVFFEKPPPLMCMNGIQRVIEPVEPSLAFSDKDCRLFRKVLRLNYIYFPGSSVSDEAVAKLHLDHPSCRISTRPFAEWQ